MIEFVLNGYGNNLFVIFGKGYNKNTKVCLDKVTNEELLKKVNEGNVYFSDCQLG